MKKHSLLFSLIFCFNLAFSQDQVFDVDGEKYIYKRPGTFDFILKAPGDFITFGKNAFNKEYTAANVGIVVSTGLLIYYDQDLYDGVAKWGRDLGIGNGDNTKTIIQIGELPIFRGPTDFGSAMYFIGDGWTHLSVSLSFLAAGLINDDNRALQTASQIAQGMVTCGFSTQLLKHITGRETPNTATQPGGIWRFFPDQGEYHKHVPHYDAFPSGHLATAMMTLTVVAENYAEYKWIRPVGYTLMTLLSLQMMNNGVHWASDYPLALGMGYLFGKIAVEQGRTELNPEKKSANSQITVTPFMAPGKTYGVSFNYFF